VGNANNASIGLSLILGINDTRNLPENNILGLSVNARPVYLRGNF
jgi:hypothetical protein